MMIMLIYDDNKLGTNKFITVRTSNNQRLLR